MVFFRLLFVLSATTMTLLTTLRGPVIAGFLGVAFSFLLFSWLIFRQGLLEKAIKPFSWLTGAIALPFAYSGGKIFMSYFYFRFEKLSRLLLDALSRYRSIDEALWQALLPVARLLLTALTAVALWVAFYWLVKVFRHYGLPFIRRMTGVEKSFWLLAAALSLLLIFSVYSRTNLFYQPAAAGQANKYDTVFTSDTGIHLQTNVFVNINAAENDLRQPLFGLFALPFGIAASWIAACFGGALPAYALALASLQAIVLAFSLILVSRLLKLRGLDQLIFLGLYFTSYPVLLFVLNLEQYVFALFWLLLFVYSLCRENLSGRAGEKEPWLWQPLCFTGAAGSMLTSGFFLLFTLKGRNLRQGLAAMIRTGLIFLAILTAFGQLPLLWEAGISLPRLLRFAGTGLPLQEKLRQYGGFLANCLTAPEAYATPNVFGQISWQLTPEQGLIWLGPVLFVLAAAAFLLHRKELYFQICLAWLLFSFCLLAGMGWGAKENGMILYTLYFSWALLSLLYGGWMKLLTRRPRLRQVLGLALVVAMAWGNLAGIRQLIQFGVIYYPG